MDDKICVVCARCDEVIPVPGLVEKKCSFCGVNVWVSPSSMKRKFDVIYCEDCFQLDYDEKEHKVFLTKETVDEFNKWKRAFGYKVEIESVIKVIEESKGMKITQENLKGEKNE